MTKHPLIFHVAESNEEGTKPSPAQKKKKSINKAPKSPKRKISPSISLSLSPNRNNIYIRKASFSSFFIQELANTQETLEESNKSVVVQVRSLYEALNSRDVGSVHRLLSPDLDWWFHGPPSHQFLMRLLTGAPNSDQDSSSSAFRFDPQSFASFGTTVIAEGCDADRSIAWVHAWTVTDGIITQVREYLNTSLTVTRLGRSSPSTSSTAEIASYYCPAVWESTLSDRVGKSVPGLILAI